MDPSCSSGPSCGLSDVLVNMHELASLVKPRALITVLGSSVWRWGTFFHPLPHET